MQTLGLSVTSLSVWRNVLWVQFCIASCRLLAIVSLSDRDSKCNNDGANVWLIVSAFHYTLVTVTREMCYTTKYVSQCHEFTWSRCLWVMCVQIQLKVWYVLSIKYFSEFWLFIWRRGPCCVVHWAKSEIQQKNVLMMSVQMSDDWSKESHSDVTRDFNCDQ